MHASGTFDVKVNVQKADNKEAESAKLGRMSLDKKFHGDLEAGEPQLSVTVVPDSGTGQLAGIAGKMTIKIADGKHFYEFEYTLTETS